MKAKQGDCDCCGFEGVMVKPYDIRRGAPMGSALGKKWLCALCAGTMTGNAHEYPEQYGREGEVMKTICYVGNAILQTIRSK